MLERQVGPLTVAGSVEYGAQTRSSARKLIWVRCTSGERDEGEKQSGRRSPS